MTNATTWTDDRYPRPVTYTVIESDVHPRVFIAPVDATDGENEGYVNAARCEIGEYCMSRDQLRDLATAILAALNQDGAR